MMRGKRGGKSRSSTEQAPKARLGEYTPNAGPWGLSSALLDFDGPDLYRWPRDPLLAGRLALTLLTLNGHPMEDFRELTRAGGDPATKWPEVWELENEAQERLNEIVVKLGEDVDPQIVQMTYCYRWSAPERIWGVYEPYQRLLYPMWWDPQHRVCGYRADKVGAANGQPCQPECPHPPTD